MTDGAITMADLERDKRIQEATRKLNEAEAKRETTCSRLEVLRAELETAVNKVDQVLVQRELGELTEDGAIAKAQARATAAREAIAQGEASLHALGKVVEIRAGQMATARKVALEEFAAEVAADYEETAQRFLKKLESVAPDYDRVLALREVLHQLQRTGLRITVSEVPQIGFQFKNPSTGSIRWEQITVRGLAALTSMEPGVIVFKPPMITVPESKVCAAELEPTPAPEPVARAMAVAERI